MEPAHPIEVTQLEVAYLSDKISMYQRGPPDALQAAPHPDLLLKIGGAILELGLEENKEGRASIHCTKNELWVMREAVKSFDVVGTEKIGLSLLHKIFEGIQALEGEFASADDVGQAPIDEPSKHDLESELRQVREKFGKEDDDDAAVKQ